MAEIIKKSVMDKIANDKAQLTELAEHLIQISENGGVFYKADVFYVETFILIYHTLYDDIISLPLSQQTRVVLKTLNLIAVAKTDAYREISKITKQ